MIIDLTCYGHGEVKRELQIPKPSFGTNSRTYVYKLADKCLDDIEGMCIVGLLEYIKRNIPSIGVALANNKLTLIDSIFNFDSDTITDEKMMDFLVKKKEIDRDTVYINWCVDQEDLGLRVLITFKVRQNISFNPNMGDKIFILPIDNT